MSSNELLAQLILSSTGTDLRMTHITGALGNPVLEYFGSTATLDTPTDVERWFISKAEYDSNECMIRLRRISQQKKWTERASLFT